MLKLVPPKFWQSRGIASYLLLPFASLYLLIITLRRIYYKLDRQPKIQVPVIVVGNITVGGTGKTPLVIFLANFLRSHGFKPGIITRGYGRNSSKNSIEVTVNSKVEEVGDEALVIAHHVECPIIVDTDRVAASQILAASSGNYRCDIIISDDGLQHYALNRDIEIVVVDAQLRFGNNFCLPAGPLREPLSRLRKVDFIINNVNTLTPVSESPDEYEMHLESTVFHNIKNNKLIKPLDCFLKQIVHAVAGIGNPQRFFQSLRQLGMKIVEHPFPDHHKYQFFDFSFSNETVIMTEKDAVKCDTLANENFWYLETKARLSARFMEKLLDRLRELGK